MYLSKGRSDQFGNNFTEYYVTYGLLFQYERFSLMEA